MPVGAASSSCALCRDTGDSGQGLRTCCARSARQTGRREGADNYFREQHEPNLPAPPACGHAQRASEYALQTHGRWGPSRELHAKVRGEGRRGPRKGIADVVLGPKQEGRQARLTGERQRERGLREAGRGPREAPGTVPEGEWSSAAAGVSA